jgi:hypothetical protein
MAINLKSLSFNCSSIYGEQLNEVYFKICSQGSWKEIMSDEISAVQHDDSIDISEETSCPCGAPPSMKMGYTARGTEPGHVSRIAS